MRRKVLALLVLVILVLAVQLWSYSSFEHSGATSKGVASSAPASTPESSAMRITAWQQWLADAAYVASATGAHDAYLLTKVLMNASYPIEPNRSGPGGVILSPPVGNEPPHFAFLPLVQSDFTNPSFAFAANAPWGAMFTTGSGTMLVREDLPCTQVWRGIIALHETYHATTYLSTHYDSTDMRIFCTQEVIAHTLQNQWASLCGGNAYQRALAAEVRRARPKFDMRYVNDIVEGGAAGRGAYDFVLEDAFGPSLSEYERETRQTSVYIHGLFTLVDESEPNEELRIRKKGSFLYGLYRKSQLLH